MKILDASEPGLGSSMTEEETRDFLSNTRLFARLGTIDKKTILMYIPYGIILIMRESIFRRVKTLRNLETSRSEIIFTFV
jgi:hypothetical protein